MILVPCPWIDIWVVHLLAWVIGKEDCQYFAGDLMPTLAGRHRQAFQHSTAFAANKSTSWQELSYSAVTCETRAEFSQLGLEAAAWAHHTCDAARGWRQLQLNQAADECFRSGRFLDELGQHAVRMLHTVAIPAPGEQTVVRAWLGQDSVNSSPGWLWDFGG